LPTLVIIITTTIHRIKETTRKNFHPNLFLEEIKVIRRTTTLKKLLREL